MWYEVIWPRAFQLRTIAGGMAWQPGDIRPYFCVGDIPKDIYDGDGMHFDAKKQTNTNFVIREVAHSIPRHDCSLRPAVLTADQCMSQADARTALFVAAAGAPVEGWPEKIDGQPVAVPLVVADEYIEALLDAPAEEKQKDAPEEA
jgi:hypothetical protein